MNLKLKVIFLYLIFTIYVKDVMSEFDKIMLNKTVHSNNNTYKSNLQRINRARGNAMIELYQQKLLFI